MYTYAFLFGAFDKPFGMGPAEILAKARQSAKQRTPVTVELIALGCCCDRAKKAL